jgi:hypothetical protein
MKKTGLAGNAEQIGRMKGTNRKFVRETSRKHPILDGKILLK